MKKIFTAKVSIPAAPLSLERLFRFETEKARDHFLSLVKEHRYTVIGFGVDHLMTAAEAIEECREEANSLN